MILTIRKINSNNKEDINQFIYAHLKTYIYALFNRLVNKKKLQLFDTEFGINSLEILRTSLRNLLITKNGETYTINTTNTIKINGNYINYYIDLITYGNREIQGYPILLKVFRFVEKNINVIYREWKHGNKILWPSPGWENQELN